MATTHTCMEVMQILYTVKHASTTQGKQRHYRAIAFFDVCIAEVPPSPDATNKTASDSDYSSPGQHPKNTDKDAFEPDMDNASPAVTQKASGAMNVRLCMGFVFTGHTPLVPHLYGIPHMPIAT